MDQLISTSGVCPICGEAMAGTVKSLGSWGQDDIRRIAIDVDCVKHCELEPGSNRRQMLDALPLR